MERRGSIASGCLSLDSGEGTSRINSAMQAIIDVLGLLENRPKSFAPNGLYESLKLSKRWNIDAVAFVQLVDRNILGVVDAALLERRMSVFRLRVTMRSPSFSALRLMKLSSSARVNPPAAWM